MFRESDRSDAQMAFVGLLASPLVTAWSDPPRYVLVRRHERELAKWAARLGYRLVHLDRCYRLRRVPIDGHVALPTVEAPPRTRLLYALYAAIMLEQHRDDSVTLQDLSDRVAMFVGVGNRWPYDPNVRGHRQKFVEAIGMLIDLGVLEQRTRDALRDDWERSGEGIGGGYLLHRDALMLMVDTGDLDLALARRAGGEDDTRGARLLRMLVEAQALYPDELTDDERDYLVRQRGRLVSLAEEMTGGAVEVRTDAWVLVLEDRGLPASLQIGFPDVSSLDWAALSLLSELVVGASGFPRVSGERVRQAAVRLHTDKGKHLKQSLRESAGALQEAVQERLVEIGLVRLERDDWILTPAAARYRDADLAVGAAPEGLFD